MTKTTRKVCSKSLCPRIPLQPQAGISRELLPAKPPRGPSFPRGRGGSVGAAGPGQAHRPPAQRSPEVNKLLTFNLALTSGLSPTFL